VVVLATAGKGMCSVFVPALSPTIKIIENKGQWDPQVLFKAAIPGGDFYITRNAFVYALIDEQALHALLHDGETSAVVKGHNYKVSFNGSNAAPMVQKINPFAEQYNYFTGNNSNNWASGCRAYEKVVLQNMYNGIDVEVVAGNESIKINYIIHPGANPAAIKLTYTGTEGLTLSEQALLIKTSLVQIKEEKPIAFQQNKEVGCRYLLTDSVLGFKLHHYNTSLPLVIDPNIVFGTYSGSVADNFGFTATFDTSGKAYAGGTVYSSGFPVTMGAYQRTFGGGSGQGLGRDMGILKFSADGSQLLYATYIGGSHNEQPHSIICNNSGELYVFGTTESANFPSTTSAYDKTHNGEADMVVCWLSADGTQLKASTFIGGTGDDGINGSKSNQQYSNSNPLTFNYGDFYRGEIKLDASGNVVVASSTRSGTGKNFPLVNNFQSAFGGGNQDGCVLRLSSDLSSLLFSSYLGGSGDDALYGVAFDATNSILVTGGTNSSNIGKNAGSLAYNGDVDGFVAKLNASGFSLQKLVYVGTSVYDQSYFIDVDADNLVYITGQTLGTYRVKGKVYDTPDGRHFISILNNNLDSLMYSTVFGTGSININLSPSAMMVDNCGKVYVSGWGGSANAGFNQSTEPTFGFETTPDAFQSTTDGSDFYLIVLSKHLSTLKYATYIGGSNSADHVDGGTSRFDKRGIVYQSICAGCGGFSDLPTTPGAYSRTNKGKRPNSTAGGCNNAVVKFGADPSDRAPILNDTLIRLTAGDSLWFATTIYDPDGDSVSVKYSGTLLTRTVNPAQIDTFYGKTFVRTTFAWRTNCTDISTDTIIINVQASDNACLRSNVSNAKIKLLISPPPMPVAPTPDCLVTLNDTTIVMKWLHTAGPPIYQSYSVYRKVGNNPFALLYQSASINDVQLTDTTAYNHLNENVCYYIQTRNACDSNSLPSRIICSLSPSDTLTQAFAFTPDTILYVTASDTLVYQFQAFSINPQDSVYIAKVTGSVFATQRVLQSTSTDNLSFASHTLAWRSLCDDINDTFDLNLLFRNNQCPRSLTQTARVRVVVVSPPVLPPPAMRCTRSVSTNSVLVRWTKPNSARYLSHYILLRYNPDGSYTQLAQTSSLEAFEFTDNQALANTSTNWCYTAYAVNICGELGDTAEQTCTVDKQDSYPGGMYIYTTTVVENKKVLTTWTRSQENDFLMYRVLRKNPTSDVYELYLEKAGIDDTLLVDNNTDVQKNVYCYRIKQVNDCGLENTDQNQSCSMLLKGTSNPFVHALQWNDFDYWRRGLDRYEIGRQDVDAPEKVVATSGYKFAFYTDDRLNTDYGLYNYTIVASEIQTGYTSTSNTVELIQAPLLHVPNAFTPNGDGTNDTWKPVPAFVKDFNLKVYDRWGQLVFETSDKKQYFDGRFKNQDVSVDAFVYVITYTGWDGSTKTLKGNVTVLR
jgi:gliding motility-associated-like protein